MLRLKLMSTVCATALALGLAPAQASGPDEGYEHHRQWYVSLYGGWARALDHKFDFVSNAGASFAYTVSHDDGYTVGGAVGILLTKNVRLELDIAHSKFDYGNNYHSLGFTGQNERGSMDLTTVMANIWFDTNLGFVSPYVGGGVGFGTASGDLTISNGSGRQFSGDDTGWAFQFGTGLRFPISSNIELDVGYRVKHVVDLNFASAITGFKTTNFDITTQAIQAGIVVKF